jgi:hypothetical protein
MPDAARGLSAQGLVDERSQQRLAFSAALQEHRLVSGEVPRVLLDFSG